MSNPQADDWILRYDGYAPDDEGRREALTAVGNGYLVTRGAAPESSADGVHYPGTYAAGVYNRLGTDVGDHFVENESLVNLPNWLAATFRIDGGSWFRIDDAELLAYHQELDLRRAVLTRHLRFRDERGRTTAVTQRRFADMQFQHVCALQMAIVAEDWSGSLEVRSVIDAAVENTLVARYRDLPSRHLDLLKAEELADDSVLLEVVTNQSGIRVAMAARNLLRCDGGQPGGERTLRNDGGQLGHDIAEHVERGQTVTLEKVVTVFTNRDPAVSEPADEAARWLDRTADFASLLEGHVVAWSHLWDRFGFSLDDRPDSLRVVRLHLLQLLQTVSPNTVEADVGVPARGLHGEAYRGHILWDEIFVFPVLNLRIPALTRSLLRYRYRRLPEARQAALAAGHDGAMYPWQSASDGREESQQWHLNPDSGRWIPDNSQLERHIGLAIAYNVWQYYQATEDRDFITHYGAEMLLEIARFFASLANYDPGLDRYVVRGVMGPDEFHSRYPSRDQPGIDNNAYTNVMTVWLMQRALETLQVLPESERAELRETLHLGPEEPERWADIGRKMFVPFHGDHIISQFEGYGDLAELDWERYLKQYDNIQRLDRILDAEGDDVNRYQASKQADALMLFYLLSKDELTGILEGLGYELRPSDVPRNIDYYLARTSHGSTLSAVVHAWVLARSHRERAVEYFSTALESDVADIQGGTTPEGIHLAAMTGSVDLLQRCFSGLELRGDRLMLDPYWPDTLGELKFSIRYREHPLTLRISGREIDVSSGAGTQRPIEVSCRGESVLLKPGSSATFTV